MDLKHSVINLRLSYARTRKYRTIIPINQGLLAALQAAQAAALSNYVVEWGGERIASIRKGFDGAETQTGDKDVTRHTIRHSAAVAMVSSGVPMERVAQYLGHNPAAITYSIYGRFAPEHLADAAELLDFVRLHA